MSVCIYPIVAYLFIYHLKIVRQQKDEIKLLKGSISSLLNVAKIRGATNVIGEGVIFDADRFINNLNVKMHNEWNHEKLKPEIQNKIDSFIDEIK